MFVPHYKNVAERNKRVSVTGKTYLGISPEGKEFVFTNIKEFARINGLCDTHVGRCLNGKAKTHKGWTFKVKKTSNERKLLNDKRENDYS